MTVLNLKMCGATVDGRFCGAEAIGTFIEVLQDERGVRGVVLCGLCKPHAEQRAALIVGTVVEGLSETLRKAIEDEDVES